MAKLISDQQLDLNRTLHDNKSDFGSRPDGGGITTRLHKAILKIHEAGLCNSVVDYGTGKGALVERLRDQLPSSISVHGYDPAFEKFNKRPEYSADILTCIDVLEHVELSSVDDVLQDISSLTSKICFLSIDLQPSVKTLADGRNAHIMLAPNDWWLNRISRVFPNFATVLIPHKLGFDQKLIVVGSCDRTLSPFLYVFANQLAIFNLIMTGGMVKK